MDILGRFYTSDIVSKLLINNFEIQTPKKVLDLGIGDASLTIAAYSKWTKAKYFATEIEKKTVNKIGKKLSFIKILNCDTLHPNISSQLKIKFGSIDIAICNPPYLKVTDKDRYDRLFKSVGCSDFLRLKRITSEIVFFAHNLKMLKSGGELGIIVSDSLITGKDFLIFRQTIQNKFNVRRIIQLPDGIFNKTEARTHIIFISKSKSLRDHTEVFMSSSNGILSTKMVVHKDDLTLRMDYQFHISKTNIKSCTKTLKDIGVIIRRGKYSFKELREKKCPYFHSTKFKENNINLQFNETVSPKDAEYTASAGDILMCRVGKRVVGRIAVIDYGSILYSDCIYRIIIPKAFQKIVLNSLSCQEGENWLKAYAHGVCSQVISKSDLEKFPLFCL